VEVKNLHLITSTSGRRQTGGVPCDRTVR
jgi:hypothetical protein